MCVRVRMCACGCVYVCMRVAMSQPYSALLHAQVSVYASMRPLPPRTPSPEISFVSDPLSRKIVLEFNDVYIIFIYGQTKSVSQFGLH